MTVESVVVDSTTNTAAIELRSVGSSKSGLAVDTLAVWICKASADDVFVEITSYVDSAFLVK